MTQHFLKLIGALLLIAPVPCLAQTPLAKTPEWVARLGELTKEKKYEEAIALVRAKAAEEPPTAEVPQAMMGLSQTLFLYDKDELALSLLREIPERFPKTSFASLAWCGMGQVYCRLGKDEEMISALERGRDGLRGHAGVRRIDLLDAYAFACHRLGQHYAKNRRWEQALAAYSDWEPNSFCGNCHAAMVAEKSERILWCLVELERFEDVAHLTWREIAEGTWAQDQLNDFVLVRLYFEAGQSDDLRSQVNGFLNLAETRLGRGTEKDLRRLDSSIRPRVGSLLKSIELAESKRYSDHIAVFAKEGNRSQSHIAAWVLIRDHARTVPLLLKEARNEHDAATLFIEFLAAADSPPADRAIKSLTTNTPPPLRNRALELQRSIAAKERERLVADEFSIPNPRLPLHWYRPWPSIAPAALPVSLPAELAEIIEKKDRK